MKYKILICIAVFSFYLNKSHADKSFNVPDNQYVLIERQLNHAKKAAYAGFKFIHQGANNKDYIKYEWISMNNGEKIVRIESQNFKFGETTGVGKFGVGFEGYRFLWEPDDHKKGGKIICAYYKCEEIVKFCLSQLQNLWEINIQKEMLKLEQENKCILLR